MSTWWGSGMPRELVKWVWLWERLRKSWAFITDWEPKVVLSKAGWHHLIVEAPTRTKGLGKNPLSLNWNTHFLLLSDTDDACSQAFWLGLGLKPALFSELQMGIELYHWFSWFSRAGQELSHPPLVCESVPTINPCLSISHLSPTGSVSLGNP